MLSRHHPASLTAAVETLPSFDDTCTLEQFAWQVFERQREAQAKNKVDSPAMRYHLPRELMMEQMDLSDSLPPTPRVALSRTSSRAKPVGSPAPNSPRPAGPTHKETLQLDHSVKQQYRERERSARELQRIRPAVPPPGRMLGRSQSANVLSKVTTWESIRKPLVDEPVERAVSSGKSPREAIDMPQEWDIPTPSSKRRDRRPPAPVRGERTAEDPITAKRPREKRERQRRTSSVPIRPRQSPPPRHSASSNSGEERREDSTIDKKSGAARKRFEKEDSKEVKEKENGGFFKTRAGTRLSQALGKLDKVLDNEASQLPAHRSESVNSSNSGGALSTLDGAAALQAVLQLPGDVDPFDGSRLLRSQKQLSALSKEVDFMWAKYTGLSEDHTPPKTRQALVNHLEKNLAKKIELMISIKEQLLKQKQRRLGAALFDPSEDEDVHGRPRRSPKFYEQNPNLDFTLLALASSDEDEEPIDTIRQRAMSWQEKNDLGVRNVFAKPKPSREAKARLALKEKPTFTEEKLMPEEEHDEDVTVTSTRARADSGSNSSRRGSGEPQAFAPVRFHEERPRSGRKDKKTANFSRR